MKNSFWLVLIVFSMWGCTSDDGDCGEFIPAPIYFNLELTDSVTNENLLTNQTFFFENLSIEAENNSDVLMNETDNDLILISFDYNNADGVYLLKNNGETILEFEVNIIQTEEDCYMYNKIGSVEFPGHAFEYNSGQNTYKVKL